MEITISILKRKISDLVRELQVLRQEIAASDQRNVKEIKTEVHLCLEEAEILETAMEALAIKHSPVLKSKAEDTLRHLRQRVRKAAMIWHRISTRRVKAKALPDPDRHKRSFYHNPHLEKGFLSW